MLPITISPRSTSPLAVDEATHGAPRGELGTRSVTPKAPDSDSDLTELFASNVTLSAESAPASPVKPSKKAEDINVSYAADIATDTARANSPSMQEMASETFAAAGYGVERKFPIREGSMVFGNGMWNLYFSCRDGLTCATYCGPGESISPRCYSIAKTFDVTFGSCDVWFWNEEKNKWSRHHKQAGDKIEIPQNVLHCFLATGREGVCMHTQIIRDTIIEYALHRALPKYFGPIEN